MVKLLAPLRSLVIKAGLDLKAVGEFGFLHAEAVHTSGDFLGELQDCSFDPVTIAPFSTFEEVAVLSVH